MSQPSHPLFNGKGQELLQTFLNSQSAGVLQKTLIFGGSNFFAQAIMMVYTFVIARWLMPESYGIFAGCYAISSLTVFFINWGLDTWLLRQAAAVEDAISSIQAIFRLKIGFGIVWSVALWVIATTIRPEVYLPTIIALAILDTWADSLFTTFTTALTVSGQIKKVSILVITSRSLKILSAAVLILLNIKALLPFSIARMVCTLIMVTAALLIVKPFRRSSQKADLRSVWHASLPYGASDFLTTIYGQADVTMVSIMAGAQPSGYYAPAVSVTNAIISAMSSFYVYFIPHLTRNQTDDPRRYWKSALRVMMWFCLVGIIISLGVRLVGPPVLILLLGKHYVPTAELISILSPILLIKALSFGCATVLVSRGLQKQRITPQIISAAANILFNAWVIPYYGITGVAYVYVLSEIILFLGYFYLVIRQYRKEAVQWTPVP